MSIVASVRRYLALWFPLLSADRWRRHTAETGPLAFVEKQRGAMRIAALDGDALELGLAPGMMLADARARVPDLVAVDHDPDADRRLLEHIADGCDRWTPMVAIDPPDGITLDLTGCGDEAAIAADAAKLLARAGLTARAACAATPEAAHALARHAPLPIGDEAAAIRALPVAALRAADDIEAALRRAGLRTIGDLADRPPAPLAARFGAETVAMLARLLGRADSRISPRRPLPALIFERRLAEPIARTEDALAILDELAHEAARALDERRGGGRRFVARLYRSDGAVRELAIDTALPTRDPAVPARLLRERIDALADPIDPGFGFDMIRLAVPAIEPLAGYQPRLAQLGLEGGGVPQEAMTALIDRLSTRLGRDRVRRFRAVDTHIPEQQALALPAVTLGDPAPWPTPAASEPPLRPLHLFDPPQPIEVVAEVPDGPPRRFRWRRTLHEVARFEGPERIAGEWWRVRVDRLPDPGESGMQPRPGRDAMDCDGEERRTPPAHRDRPARPLLTRDYFRIEDVRGRRFWLFRHGLYGEEADRPAWYLHGLFA